MNKAYVHGTRSIYENFHDHTGSNWSLDLAVAKSVLQAGNYSNFQTLQLASATDAAVHHSELNLRQYDQLVRCRCSHSFICASGGDTESQQGSTRQAHKIGWSPIKLMVLLLHSDNSNADTVPRLVGHLVLNLLFAMCTKSLLVWLFCLPMHLLTRRFD